MMTYLLIGMLLHWAIVVEVALLIRMVRHSIDLDAPLTAGHIACYGAIVIAALAVAMKLWKGK